MKKAVKSTIFVLLLFCLMCGSVKAAETVSVMNAWTESDELVLFIENPGQEIEHVYIGSEETSTFEEADCGGIRTIVLLDNSLSIKQTYRDRITSFLLDLAASKKDDDTITLATFSEDITYLVRDCGDYLELKEQIEAIEYANQEAYFSNTLYTVLDELDEYEDVKYTRVIIISDGMDDETYGYTDDELNAKVQETGVPIYTIGCTGTSEENLKRMFSISRLTNGQSFLMDDVTDTEILQTIQDEADVIMVTVTPQDSVCDGTKRSVRLTFGENYCSVEMTMPFKAATTGAETEEDLAEEVIIEEEADEAEAVIEEVEETAEESEEESENTFPLVIIVIGAVVVLIAVTVVILALKKTRVDKTVGANMPDISSIGNDVSLNSGDGEETMIVTSSEGHETMIFHENTGISTLTLQNIHDLTHTYECTFHNSVVVGRDSSRCRIVIPEDKYIGRTQCEFFLKDGQVHLRDGAENGEPSKNGTYLDDQKVTWEMPVPYGSVLKIGKSSFKVMYQ